MAYPLMRDRMIDLLSEIDKANFADAPEYQLMVLLSNRFKSLGVPDYVAERLVANMKITLSGECVQDKALMEKVLDTYGDAVRRMLAQIKQDFPSCPYDVLLALAPKLQIEMNF